MLFDYIPSFAQRLGFGDTVFVGDHRSRQPAAVFIGIVDIKLYALDGCTIQGIGLDNLHPALGGLVLHADFIGFLILCARDAGAEMVIHIMQRHFAFNDFIFAPSQ